MTGRVKFLPPDCEIIHPFACRETLYQDVHGDEKVHLDVWLLPTYYSKYSWPKKWEFPEVRRDSTNDLPMMLWRQYDHDPCEGSNAGINWAPRACFIWRSKSEKQPPQFVNISFDNQLSIFFTAACILGPIALLYLIACAFTIAHHCLGSHACRNWGFNPSTFNAIGSVLHDPTGIIALIATCLAVYILPARIVLGFPIKSALFIDKIIARLIWRGLTPQFRRGKQFRMRIPGYITPDVHIAPWAALEAFEIKFKPKSDKPEDPDTDRVKIRASFGRAASETDILNGTNDEDDAREFHRLLTDAFLDRRPYYLAQMRENDEARAARDSEADRLEKQARQLNGEAIKQYQEQLKILDKSVALEKQRDTYRHQAGQTGVRAMLRRLTRSAPTPEQAELIQKAEQCDAESEELLAQAQPLGENAGELAKQSDELFERASELRNRRLADLRNQPQDDTTASA